MAIDTDAMEQFHAEISATKTAAHASGDTSHFGMQTAGYMPAVPAGPGGDKPQDNPFGTRTPAIPFGKRTG